MIVSEISFILILLCFCDTYNAERDYFSTGSNSASNEEERVDPHSFFYDKRSKQESRIALIDMKDEDIDQQSCSYVKQTLHECLFLLRHRPRSTDISDELLSRRLINMLLTKGNLKKEGTVFIGNIDLEITDQELNTLRDFGQGKVILRKIDPILNRMIKTPSQKYISSGYGYVLEFVSIICNIGLWGYSAAFSIGTLSATKKEFVAIIIVVLSAIYTRKMKYNKLATLFIISLFITWWKLVQEAEIKHFTLQMENTQLPIHCHPEKMSYWDKIWTLFSSKEDCEKYYAARMKTPFFEVTPILALSHMLSQIIFEPLEMSGKAFSSFLKNFTANMYFYERFAVMILLSLTFIPALIVCIILLCGGSLSFGPFSFLKIKGPNGEQKNKKLGVETKRRRQPVEVLLNVNLNVANTEKPISPPAVTYDSKVGDLENKRNDETIIDQVIHGLKETNSENNGSGDCNPNNETSSSETESFEEISRTETNILREDGSGDRIVK